MASAISATAQSGPVAKPLKIAFLYLQKASTLGWSYQHDLGRKALQQVLGPLVNVRTVEQVRSGTKMEATVDELVASGHRLIFTTSFSYMDATLRLAARHRDVFFVNAAGFKTAPNLSCYNARAYEGTFLTGMLAGRMTRSNQVGYVASYPIPEVLQGINAFARGLHTVNPHAQLSLRWLGDWYQPETERRLALELIDQGADVLTHHTDTASTVEAAEARGKFSIGYHSDMRAVAPKGSLSSVLLDWGGYYVKTARAVLEGHWQPSRTWGGVDAGFVRLAPFGEVVPELVRREIEAWRDKIVTGAFSPFTGRIVDNTGTVRQLRGKMSDDTLMRMNYLVEGIADRLPTS